jgi:RecA/RadA recombinase
MSTVLDRILKNSTNKLAAKLSESSLFEAAETIQTKVPMVNVLFSGRMDGGIANGISVFAAGSRMFKSSFLLLCIRAFQDKYPDGATIFADSEFGATLALFDSFGVDTSKVAHIPVKTIEELKFELVRQLDTFEEGTNLLIVVDSLGNLASDKEVDDAVEGKSVADMTRAKSLKSLFRIITPHLKIKNIPMIVAGHVYQEQSTHPREIMSGGRGMEYASDSIFFISRRQNKNEKTKTIEGWDFVVKVQKSRFVKEGSSVVVEATYEDGINNFSGLLDIAVESGHVDNSSQGWYVKKGEDKKYRKDNTNTTAFWASILQDETFQEYVTDKYLLKPGSLLRELDEFTDSEPEAQDEPTSDASSNVESFDDLKPKKKRAK